MALRDTALNIVIRLKDLTKGALKKFKGEIKDTDREAKKAATGGLKKLALSIGGVVTAAAGFTLVKRGITAVLSTGDKFEKLGIQMEAVMGSIKGGEQATEWIKEFTKTTPLQLEDTTRAFLRLKSFGLDPMDGSMQAVVDQSEKLGGGQEKMIGIANALGQAWAKQRLQGEEILQLVERGVPVYDLLAKVTGKNGKALQEMQEKGELTRDVISALIKEMGKAATGAAAANMTTMSGIVSNLKDQWQEWLAQVADSGALDNFKTLLSDLAQNLKRLASDGTLNVWAKQTSDAIISLFGGIKSLATTIYDARGAIELFVKAWAGLKIASLVTGIGGLARTFVGVLTPGVTASTTALKGLGTAMRGIVWAGLIDAVLQTAAAFKTLAAEKAKLADSLSAAATIEDEATRRIQEYREQTGLAAKSIDDLIAAQESGLAIFDQANQTWITGAEAVQAYKDNAGAVVGTIEELVGVIENELPSAIASGVAAFDALTESGDRADEALKDIFKGYDLKVTSDVRELIGVMADLQDSGKLTADVIRDELGRALSDLTADELRAFAINAKYAFDSGIIGAEDFAATIDDTVSAALRSLGVDIGLVETGITTIGDEAIRAFSLVEQSIADSSDAADVAGEKIVAAYKAAFRKVKTEAGKAKLLKALQAALDKGRISAVQFKKALKALGEGADEDSVKIKALKNEVLRLRDVLQGGDGNIQLTDDIAAGAEGAHTATELLMSAIDGFKEQMAELGPAALEAFNQTALGAEAPLDEIDELRTRLGDVKTELADLGYESFRVFDATGLRGALIDLNVAARSTEETFLEQKIAAQALFDEYENGAIRADIFANKAERMIKNSALLNDEDISNLTGGIEKAVQQMDRLNASTERTLTNLQNKLDRLRGDTEAAELRDYQNQIADLNGQLEQAQYFKNEQSIKDLTESLRITKEVYEVEKQNRKEADAARRKRDQERIARATSAEKSQGAPEASGRQNTSNQQTIVLKAGNQSIQVSTDNPNGLLDILAEAGLRTG